MFFFQILNFCKTVFREIRAFSGRVQPGFLGVEMVVIIHPENETPNS